jgi:hypothetical protein
LPPPSCTNPRTGQLGTPPAHHLLAEWQVVQPLKDDRRRRRRRTTAAGSGGVHDQTISLSLSRPVVDRPLHASASTCVAADSTPSVFRPVSKTPPYRYHPLVQNQPAVQRGGAAAGSISSCRDATRHNAGGTLERKRTETAPHVGGIVENKAKTSGRRRARFYYAIVVGRRPGRTPIHHPLLKLQSKQHELS